MGKIVVSKNGSKKDAIIKKAAALFRKKGFSASSMRDIAESIGVEAPSLYNHIGSKTEILHTICFKVADDFTSHLNNVEKSKSSAIVKIETLIRFHIHMMLESFDELFVANHEWKQLPDPYLGTFLAQRQQYENKFIDIISKGIQKKELKNIQPHVAVLTILSAVRGLEFWQRHKKNVSTTELENDIITHLLTGLIN